MTKKNKDFGVFIKKIRKQRKYSLRQVGAAIGCSAQYICDVEQGRRSPFRDDKLVALAHYYNISIHQLLQASGRINPDIAADRIEKVQAVLRDRWHSAIVLEQLDKIEALALALHDRQGYMSGECQNMVSELVFQIDRILDRLGKGA